MYALRSVRFSFRSTIHCIVYIVQKDNAARVGFRNKYEALCDMKYKCLWVSVLRISFKQVKYFS